ncbi:hypothetical protein CWE02_06450 [Brucella pituitosa]|nr:hypothetical protein CWE02_06450 [Brucella pituitosa]
MGLQENIIDGTPAFTPQKIDKMQSILQPVILTNRRVTLPMPAPDDILYLHVEPSDASRIRVGQSMGQF